MSEPSHLYVRVDAVPDRLTDPGPGRHFWIVTVGFQLPDQVARNIAEGRGDPGDVMLDHETLLFPPQMGCYKCEEQLTPRLYYRRCTGTM